MTNVCEVTAKRALLNYAIIQDIPFAVSQVIEDAILYNKDVKMNLRHPFLIYGLCKQVRVPLEGNEAWIHPIKVIMVKKDKPSVPRPEEVYDSGNEPSNEDELRAYQSRFGIRVDAQGEAGQSSTQPPPPLQPSHEDDRETPKLRGPVDNSSMCGIPVGIAYLDTTISRPIHWNPFMHIY